MKIVRLFLVPALMLFLVSCSKDDDNPTGEEEPEGIVGEWLLEEYTYEYTSSVKFGPSQDVTVIKGKTVPIDAVLVLNDDKTYSAEGKFTLTQSSTANGETLEEQLERGFTGSGNYSVDGDTFIFDASFVATESGLIGKFDIVKNSETELVLQSEETRTGSENEVEVETVEKRLYRFWRE